MIELANFNCTFDDGKKAMMEFFDDIVYPALTSGLVRKRGEVNNFLEHVNIMEINNRKILYGVCVKDTIIKIQSRYSENSGLISVDESYKSSPCSIFILCLKTHRMGFYKIQKGSPDIHSFKTTVEFLLKRYIREKENLPNVILNIVPIPSEEKLSNSLSQLSKIDKITYKLFSLNHGVDSSEAIENIHKLSNRINAPTVSVNFNSPQNRHEISKVIEETQGKSNIVIRGRNINGDKVVLENDNFKECVSMDKNENVDFLNIENYIIKLWERISAHKIFRLNR